MINEDYVSYEVAKLLKEKGFNWMCYGYYNKDDEDSEPYFGDGEGADNWNNQASSVKELWCSAPTHQMAMKWLREKGIYITINFNPTDQDNITWWVQIMSKEHYKELLDVPTFEQATEAALKYCLIELI